MNFLNADKKVNILPLRVHQFVWLYTVLTVVMFSYPTVSRLLSLQVGWTSLVPLIACFALLLNGLFSLLLSRLTVRWLSGLLMFCNAVALYFINNYNISIDEEMIRNVVMTDWREVYDLLNIKFFSYLVFLGAVPAYLTYVIPLHYGSRLRDLGWRTLNLLGSLVLFLALFWFNCRGLIPLLRVERDLGGKAIPLNYLVSVSKLTHKFFKYRSVGQAKLPIATDSSLDDNFYRQCQRKNLLVVVVGEAARAEQFSLNGYARDTNEPLRKYPLVNFTNFHACGTSTAVSVPCMFSHLNRETFNVDKGRRYENLMGLLQRHGFALRWYDNNSGCQGVCEGVPTRNYFDHVKANNPYCNREECFDEVMLEEFVKDLEELSAKNVVVVLHQKGSHGPAYYKRVPKAHRKFGPVCESALFEKCTQQELVNAYDNTIYYTSHFLSRVIATLQERFKDYNSALLYVSDHGQSLGENGLYLHGAPRFMAPSQQTHIPALFWMSNNFAQAFKLNLGCLRAKAGNNFSHDFIFHSILGLLRINSAEYRADLDLFHSCEKNI